MILVTGFSQSPISFPNHKLYCIRLVRLFFKSRLVKEKISVIPSFLWHSLTEGHTVV